jgi:predicted amidohydrolase YtcJ
MRRVNIILASIACLLSCLYSCHFRNEKADLVIHNAKIYTVNDNFDIQQAVAIRQGKIIAIGPEREILNQYKAERYIDCQGTAVYPGFIDSHCHFLSYGRKLSAVDLVGTKSFEEVLNKVASFQKTNNRKWILGAGWDQNDWLDKTFPDCSALDSLYPETPVVLKRIDGHAMLVNSIVLKMAGINSSTQISGGMIELKNGKLTGILVDNAMDMVQNIIPVPTKEEDTESLLKAQANCFEVGLTTVDEAGLLLKDIQLIKELQTDSRLLIRIYAMMSDNTENFNYYMNHGIDTTERLTVRAFKFYADGALGSWGACLINPYQDKPLESGAMLNTKEHFYQAALQLRKNGFQMCTHAIGDSANRVILDLYGEVVGNMPDHRWRIEHAQVVNQNDFDKFGKFHVIPSVQPTHATSDMPWAEVRLGRNRVMRAYAYKLLKEQMGMIPLGTDFPIEGIAPLNTFYAAVARKDIEGKPDGGFHYENALTRIDALRGMTIWGAISNFEENTKGTIEVGKMADLVILDTDIMECVESDILKTRVLYTIVGGDLVYGDK